MGSALSQRPHQLRCAGLACLPSLKVRSASFLLDQPSAAILDPRRGGRHAPNDSILGRRSPLLPHYVPKAQTPRCPASHAGPMKDITVPELYERLSQGRNTGQLVGRESEMEGIHAFLGPTVAPCSSLASPVSARPSSWTLHRKRPPLWTCASS